MTKLFAPLFAAAFVIGLSAAPVLTYAQDDPIEESEEGTTDAGDESADTDTKDEAPAEDPMEESEDSE